MGIFELLRKSNDVKIIVEGIETREQFDTAIELGADLVQGFYLGIPNYHLNTFPSILDVESIQDHVQNISAPY